MASLSIVNNFSLLSNGRYKYGKQGLADAALATALAISVNGTTHYVEGSLATASIVTVFDDDDDVPADWVYLYYWADQISYIQIIGSATNAIFKVAATQPFVLAGYDSILAAANTTPIAGNSEPTLTDIDSIVLGNYSGSTMNYLFAVIN